MNCSHLEACFASEMAVGHAGFHPLFDLHMARECDCVDRASVSCAFLALLTGDYAVRSQLVWHILGFSH